MDQADLEDFELINMLPNKPSNEVRLRAPINVPVNGDTTSVTLTRGHGVNLFPQQRVTLLAQIGMPQTELAQEMKAVVEDCVKAGDVVKVKVMEVDVPRKRIGLSMRLDDGPGEKTEGPKGGSRRPAKNQGGQKSRQGGNQGAALGSMGALLQEAMKKK